MMKNFLAIISFAAAASVASARDAILFEGKDITAAVDYLESQIQTIKQPVKVYNWSTNGQLGDGPELLQYARRGATSFWWNYGVQDNGGNLYGFGLYAAIDPAASASFGGYGDQWLVLEMTLPTGFRMIDLVIPEKPASEDAKTALMSVACPARLNDFFWAGGRSLQDSCKRFVRHVFQNLLNIDGFAYPWAETSFKGCNRDWSLGNRAWVITSPNWMKPELIEAYTVKSTKNIEARIQIQSLFISSTEFDPTKVELNSIGEYLINHPEMDFDSASVTCAGATCTINVKFCSETSQCDEMKLPPIPRRGGGIIEKSNAYRLFWPDLVGKPKSSTTVKWLTENLFGCNGKLPYSEKGAGK